MNRQTDKVSKTPASLNPSADEIRSMGGAAIELVARYLESVDSLPVMPDTTSAAVKASLPQKLPVEGVGFEELLGLVDTSIFAQSRHNAHPRFFGYVAPPGTTATAVADLLASTLNPTVTSWRSAPSATEIELLTIDWIKQIIGYPKSSIGLYVSGGSMANMSGLAVARDSALGTSVIASGLQAAGRSLRMYVSSDGHHSSAKAASLLGIGSENVQQVGINANREMDVQHLVKLIESDLERGHQPFCIVASAGTTITGAIDPLAEIAQVAERFGIWFHVDACYGGFAAMSPQFKNRFSGIERADSVALDPHKWLFVPADCGCILYRSPEKARATFGHKADYIRVIGQEPAESFAFWDYGPELTRRFRALKVWMMFSHVGRRDLTTAIEKNCACAQHVGNIIHEAADLELLAPVGLSVFCFRYIPAEFQNGDGGRLQHSPDVNEKLNSLNEKILEQLQRDGSSYLSNANIDGQFALRGCVLNFKTTLNDMDILVDDVRRAANKVVGIGR